MRRFALPAFAILALSLAAPAAADIAPRKPRGEVPRAPRVDPLAGSSRIASPSPRRETRDIRERIERGRKNGTISRQEARQLKREARRIGRSGSVYGRDGLSESERRELDVRAEVLRDAVSRASRRP